MVEINIPEEEARALSAIDAKELNRLIDDALREERAAPLFSLPLTDCGPYVAGRLRTFERALADHAQARALRKRAETDDRVRRAGRDLAYAVSAMKHRLAGEEKDGQLFHVDDQIMPPLHFENRLSVRIVFRWRRSIDEEWTYGNITFHHEVDPRPDYSVPVPKRKPRVARQVQEKQERLFRTWEDLTRGGLHSVKEFLKGGGVGSDIPVTYRASVDPYSRALNNHSTRFWLQPS